VLALVIVAAGLAVFSPALNGDWLWDDERDLPDNPVMHEAGALDKIWFAPQSPDYFPLKATFQWVQWQLWDEHRAGYHLANLALHLACALLLWRLFRRLGLRFAWFGGLIFAVHPLVVESVAWIAEQKNTTSLFLLLLATHAFLSFEAERKRWSYAAALALFVAALLCKTSVVMFPVVILLHAWWRRGRIARADVQASVPFFAVSLALGLITIWYQHSRAIGHWTVALGGLDARLANAGLALQFYLTKSLWPVGLLPIYPKWNVAPPTLSQFWPWPVLGALLWLLWRQRATWGRHALLGLGFFLINLLPVLGFIKMAYMYFSWVADHFAYVSLIGIIGLALGAAEWAAARLPHLARKGAAAAAFVAIALLAFASFRYAGNFQSQEALCRYTLQHNPAAWAAHLNLGTLLVKTGRDAEGLVHLNQALALNPTHAETLNNLGYALARRGQVAEAIASYEEALRLRPEYALAEANLGNALVQQGRAAEALAHHEAALRLRPGFADAHWGMGNALLRLGRPAEARQHFEAALQADPKFAEAHAGLADALAAAGDAAGAMTHYRDALRFKPDLADAANNLGTLLEQAGRPEEAIACYREALRHAPDHVDTHVNLANTLASAGLMAEAAEHYETALRLKPDDAAAHTNFGTALARANRMPEALPHFQTAARLDPDNPGVHTNLANALLTLGRAAEARREYARALQLQPNYAPARTMLDELDRARN
jgi:tetratricopeptide (TPR) repeat protein